MGEEKGKERKEDMKGKEGKGITDWGKNGEGKERSVERKGWKKKTGEEEKTGIRKEGERTRRKTEDKAGIWENRKKRKSKENMWKKGLY